MKASHQHISTSTAPTVFSQKVKTIGCINPQPEGARTRDHAAQSSHLLAEYCTLMSAATQNMYHCKSLLCCTRAHPYVCKLPVRIRDPSPFLSLVRFSAPLASFKRNDVEARLLSLKKATRRRERGRSRAGASLPPILSSFQAGWQQRPWRVGRMSS